MTRKTIDVYLCDWMFLPSLLKSCCPLLDLSMIYYDVQLMGLFLPLLVLLQAKELV